MMHNTVAQFQLSREKADEKNRSMLSRSSENKLTVEFDRGQSTVTQRAKHKKSIRKTVFVI